MLSAQFSSTRWVPRAASPHSRGADGHTTPHQKTRAVIIKGAVPGYSVKTSHSTLTLLSFTSHLLSFWNAGMISEVPPRSGPIGCLVRATNTAKGSHTGERETHVTWGICWDTATPQASNAAGVRPGPRAHLQNTCHLGLRPGSSCKLRVQLLQRRAKKVGDKWRDRCSGVSDDCVLLSHLLLFNPSQKHISGSRLSSEIMCLFLPRSGSGRCVRASVGYISTALYGCMCVCVCVCVCVCAAVARGARGRG